MVSGFKSGKGFTRPLTATVLLAAPVDEQVMLPDGEPVAEDIILTYITVELTVPPTGTNDRVVVNPLAGVIDTSKPGIAVTIILLINDEPETVNDCVAEADPSQVINVVSEPATVITWAFTEKLIRNKKQKSSSLDILIL